MKAGSKWIVGGGLLALVLAGCGGGGGGSDPAKPPSGGASSQAGGSGAAGGAAGQGNTGGGAAGSGGAGGAGGAVQPPPAGTFSQKASWTFVMPASGQALCYDFDAAAEVADCQGNKWDVQVKAQGRSPQFATNSGTSGPGRAGVYAGAGRVMMSWADLQAWPDATRDPKTGEVLPTRIYFPDAAAGVFSSNNAMNSSVFEYGLGGAGDHLLYPSYRVFLITTDSSSLDPVGTAQAPVFALQVIGYYGGASGTSSGYPRFRWVDRRTPGTVREAQLDASKGWKFFNLVTGAEATEDGEWHIGFNRYRARLNGGDSGKGKVGGVIGLTPPSLYEGETQKPNAAALMAAQPGQFLADLSSASLPDSVKAWQLDGRASRLMPEVTGAPNANGVREFGWYNYYPTAELAQAAGLPATTGHVLGAAADKGMLVRGGEGTSYARMRLSKIEYQDPANPRSPQTWTFEFEVQPPAK